MKILIVDDDRNICKTTAVALKGLGHEALEAHDEIKALEQLNRHGFHVVFLDLKLAGGISGLELLPKILNSSPNLHVVIFTAHASIETAVRAIQQGATDFLEKPFTPDRIEVVLSKIEKTRKLQDRVAELEDRLSFEDDREVSFVSDSPLMQEVYATCKKAAASEANILILGESGTGKSVLANDIHRFSPRSDKRFVTVSCPTLTHELLASELFGHVRGSFTGAIKDKWGKVAAADRGTLFLDEIGDLPLDIQPKLLRLLQEKEYERVGETTTRNADVRVIAASNCPIQERVEEGKFREDLFYRLNVITVRMPSLHERKDDLKRLTNDFVEHFAKQCGRRVSGFSEPAWNWMLEYHWPGNIRELKNAVERAVILAESDTLELNSLIGNMENRDLAATDSAVEIGQPATLKELEEEHIQRIIRISDTMEEAAQTLGIDPATLYRKRKQFEKKTG